MGDMIRSREVADALTLHYQRQEKSAARSGQKDDGVRDYPWRPVAQGNDVTQ